MGDMPTGKYLNKIMGKLWQSPCPPPCDCEKITIDPSGAYVCLVDTGHENLNNQIDRFSNN